MVAIEVLSKGRDFDPMKPQHVHHLGDRGGVEAAPGLSPVEYVGKSLEGIFRQGGLQMEHLVGSVDRLNVVSNDLQDAMFRMLSSDSHCTVAGAQLNILGSPLRDPLRSTSTRDQRREQRSVCAGPVRIELRGGPAPFEGELLDISANGFRMSFTYPAPETGTEVEFSHEFFRGRARIIWTLQQGSHFEAGCMVLRD